MRRDRARIGMRVFDGYSMATETALRPFRYEIISEPFEGKRDSIGRPCWYVKLRREDGRIIERSINRLQEA